MNIYAPDYYNKFKCIADKCKNNCCIGWEIDIDEDMLGFYKDVQGSFGKKLKENIDFKNPHFILTENERCPFLGKNNLCEIIENLGEDKLCQICTDHPRFRNFFDSRTEIGLGLCCEEAARVILTNKSKVAVLKISGDFSENTDDEMFFNFRTQLFSYIQDRTKPIEERIASVIDRYNLIFPQKSIDEWIDVYMSLEHLDQRWHDMLLKLRHNKKECHFKDETAFEQLIIYFLYRHLPDVMYDGRMKERILFSFLSLFIIKSIMGTYSFTKIEEFIEISRMYSSEIEYSEDNLETLLKELH